MHSAVKVSFILGACSLVCMALNTVLSILIAMIGTFVSLLIIREKKAKAALLFNIIVLIIVIVSFVWLINNYTLLE